MNERIKELSEQAQLYARQGMAKTVIELKRYDADVASERYAKDFEQKFAELIVQECSQLILDKKMGDLGDNPGVKAWEEGYNEAVHDCYYLIRKHFGVEE